MMHVGVSTRARTLFRITLGQRTCSTVTFSPIGVLHSPFSRRHNTPRQAVCASSLDCEGTGPQRATVKLNDSRDLERAIHDLEGFEYTSASPLFG